MLRRSNLNGFYKMADQRKPDKTHFCSRSMLTLQHHKLVFVASESKLNQVQSNLKQISIIKSKSLLHPHWLNFHTSSQPPHPWVSLLLPSVIIISCILLLLAAYCSFMNITSYNKKHIKIYSKAMIHASIFIFMPYI